MQMRLGFRQQYPLTLQTVLVGDVAESLDGGERKPRKGRKEGREEEPNHLLAAAMAGPQIAPIDICCSSAAS